MCGESRPLLRAGPWRESLQPEGEQGRRRPGKGESQESRGPTQGTGNSRACGLSLDSGLEFTSHVCEMCVLQKHILKTNGVGGTEQKTRLKTLWRLLVPENSKCNNIWGALVDI